MARRYPNKRRSRSYGAVWGLIAAIVAATLIVIGVQVFPPAGLPGKDAGRALLAWLLGDSSWSAMSLLWPTGIASQVDEVFRVARAIPPACIVVGTLLGIARPKWIDRHPPEDGQTRLFPPPDGAREACRRFAPLRKRQGSGILLAPGVPLPREREVKGIAFVGRMGSGKTVAIRYLVDQIRAAPGARAIVLDFKGDVTSHWPDDDFVLLAPHDGRVRPEATQPYAYGWDIAADCASDAQCNEFAAALIPEGREAMWSKGARAILAGCMIGLRDSSYNRALRRSMWTWRDLEAVLDLAPEALCAYLFEHYPPTRHFLTIENGGWSKTSLSFMSTVLSAALEVVRPLAAAWGDVPMHRLLPLRRWVLTPTEKDPRFVILQFSGEYPSLSAAWTSAVVRALVTVGQSPVLAEDKARRVFFILDEMPQIARKDDGISRLLEVGRSKGFGLIAGIQSFEQLDGAWEKDKADTFRGTVGIKIVGELGATGDERVSANRASAILGKARFIRRKVSWTYSKGTRTRNVGPEPYEDFVVPPAFFETLGPQPDGVEMALLEAGQCMVLKWPYDSWKARRPGVVPTAAFDSWLEKADPEYWQELTAAAERARDEESRAIHHAKRRAHRGHWLRGLASSAVVTAGLIAGTEWYRGQPLGVGMHALAIGKAATYHTRTGHLLSWALTTAEGGVEVIDGNARHVAVAVPNGKGGVFHVLVDRTDVVRALPWE